MSVNSIVRTVWQHAFWGLKFRGLVIEVASQQDGKIPVELLYAAQISQDDMRKPCQAVPIGSYDMLMRLLLQRKKL